MTAPIQEPSTDRALQGFAFARDQLFRRPGPRVGAGLPTAYMNNPTFVMTPASSLTHTGLDNFFTTDAAVFAQDDGTYAPNTEYIDILAPGIYATFIQIKKTLNNGQFAIKLYPAAGGAFFGAADAFNQQTTSNFMDANVLLGAFSPYDISLLTLDTNDVIPNAASSYTAKYQWTNVTGSPTVTTEVVLVIVQISPIYLFT